MVALVVLAAAAAVPRSAARAAPASPAGCAPTDAPGGEWRSYGHDFANTRNQDQERSIGGFEAATLAPAWTFSSTAAGGEGDFTGVPVVADGCVFAGSNGGWVFAMNADTGALVWKARLPRGGVNSTVAVENGRVFAGVSSVSKAPCNGSGCKGPYAIALDERTGRMRWRTTLDTQRGSDVYGSPVVFDGLVFLGVSGGSAELSDENERDALEGSFVLLDERTGGVVRKTWTIPKSDWAKGYAGAGIWSTPAIDTTTKMAYVGTANPFDKQKKHPHADAVVKIDLDRRRSTFGQIVGYHDGQIDTYVDAATAPCVDIPGNPAPYYPQGLGSCGDIDLDFGANPNLFKDPSGRLLVGDGQKSGVYHAFDPVTMNNVWQAVVGPPSSVGGIVGSTATDGSAIYGPITPVGYLWSVATGGTQRWVSPTADGVHYGESAAVANGIVYTVDLTGFLDAYDARDGVPLLHRPMVLGSGTGTNPVLSWGNVSVARNTVYAGVGISGLSDGFIIAFRPGGLGGVGAPPSLPAPKLPAGETVVAGPGAYVTTYATPLVAIPQGGSLSFTSVDLPQHDVTADALDKNGQPLFGSKLIGLGQTTPVDGVNRLTPGSYSFTCSIHPGMHGTLVVL